MVYYSQAFSPLSGVVGVGVGGVGGDRHKRQTKYTCTHFEYHGYRHVILKV